MLRFALVAATVLWAFGTALACPASYYGSAHHGRKTASGERFDMHAMTAAHPSWRFGTKVRVTYRGKSVVVRINDRGPFTGGRCIDLSQGAAAELGMIRAGVGNVTLQRLN